MNVKKIKTYVAGGILPEQLVSLIRSLVEAKDDEADHSRSPLLFGPEFIKCLTTYVPSPYWAQVLTYILGEGLITAYNMLQDGQSIPEIISVPIKPRNQNKLYIPIRFDFERFIKVLTTKIDTNFWAEIDPENEDNIKKIDEKFGKALPLGYDLGDAMMIQDDSDKDKPPTLVARGYVSPHIGTIHNIIGGWKTASKIGILRQYQKETYEIKPGKKQIIDLLDAHGNPISSNDDVVFSKNLLTRKGFDVDSEGRVIYTLYDASGNEYKIAYSIPVLFPGALIASSDIKKIKKLTDIVIKEESKTAVDDYRELVNGMKRYGLQHFLASKFNHEYAQRVRLSMAGNFERGSIKYGALQIGAGTRQAFKGTEEEEEIIFKYFIQDKYENDKYFVKKINGEGYEVSPVILGVDSGIKTLNKFSLERYALERYKLDIFQVAAISIKNNVGTWSKLIDDMKKAIQEGSKEEVEKIRKIIYKQVLAMADNITRSVAQYDWGRGTRRKRGSGSVLVSYDATSATGDAIVNTLTGGDGSGNYSNVARASTFGGNEDDARSPGQKKTFRTIGSRSIAGGAEINFDSAHSYRQMLERASALAKTIDPPRKFDSKDSTSLEQVTSKIDRNLDKINEIFDEYVVYYTANELAKGNYDFNMIDAFEYANDELKKILGKEHSVEMPSELSDELILKMKSFELSKLEAMQNLGLIKPKEINKNDDDENDENEGEHISDRMLRSVLLAVKQPGFAEKMATNSAFKASIAKLIKEIDNEANRKKVLGAIASKMAEYQLQQDEKAIKDMYKKDFEGLVEMYTKNQKYRRLILSSQDIEVVKIKEMILKHLSSKGNENAN